MVPPSRGFPGNLQQVALTTNIVVSYQVQQQTTSFCAASAGSPGHCSRCTQSAIGASGCIRLPTSSHLEQSGGEVAGHPIQESYPNCPGVAQHALVLGPGGHVQPNPTESAQSAQPVNTVLR